MDEPISRRGGTWLVLLLAVALAAALGAAVVSVGRPAVALFGETGTQTGTRTTAATDRARCSGCGDQIAPPASGSTAPRPRSAPTRAQDTSDAAIVRSVATGARAATPPAATGGTAARPAASAPPAGAPGCAGTVPSLLQSLLAPIADVCVGL